MIFFLHAVWMLCKFSQFLSQSNKTWLALNSRSAYQLSFSSSAFFFKDSNCATSFSCLTGSSSFFFSRYCCWSIWLTASLISPFLHPSYCCTWQFNSIKKHLVNSVTLSFWKRKVHIVFHGNANVFWSLSCCYVLSFCATINGLVPFLVSLTPESLATCFGHTIHIMK